MKFNKTFIALAIAGMALAACSNNDNKEAAADSTAMDTTMTDTLGTDTGMVKPADSTTSFRNDRGTDSVSAGKSIPAKP